MKNNISLASYILGAISCQLVGMLGAFVTVGAIPTWYATLVRPTWQPPNWLFGPVWTTLYALIGIVGVRIWHRTKKGDVERRLFAAQLVLNGLWTPVFFGAQNLLGGLVMIVSLDVVAIGIFTKLFRKDRVAFWMWAPYIAWILFATCLNAAILMLNP